MEEVKVGTKLLEFMGLRERKLEIVSCPSCGRAQVDVWTLAEEVEAGLKDVKAPLRVAVMGCVVNGPGEAREVDFGCASGNVEVVSLICDEAFEELDILLSPPICSPACWAICSGAGAGRA